MPLLFWIAEGMVIGWLVGKLISSEGRDRLMNIAIGGVAGAVGGGFLINVAPILVHGKMIYTNLAASSGAMLMAFSSRYIGQSREYSRTN
jgi:uncharacterized membrane protein YeaQ/YmgE (transglycosylase-associated protein family)